MTRQFSDAARDRLTEPWEECVLYVYDDKRAKVHGKYVEWDGGEVRGTLTIGFGHTDAAGGLKITKGLRLASREEAGELLTRDLAPVIADINRWLTVETTQHQFDSMVDTGFNCPVAAKAAIKLINAGQSEKVPAKLLQYVCSKGERMEGLVHRRTAEIAWFNTPDDVEAPPAPNPDIVHSPKAERNPPPIPPHESKQIVGGASIFVGAIAELLKSLNDFLDPLKQAKGSLDDLGMGGGIAAALHDPFVLACMAVAGLAAFLVIERHSRLKNDHV